MPEPLNVSNTLVNQPVNYIGHNPYRWKWIGKWDSEIFLKDFYQNEELGVPQYDLICGEGIVVMDDVEGGQCGPTTTVIEDPPTPDETYKVDIIYFSYYKEPDGWGTMVESQIEYVHKDIVAEKKGDIYEIDVTDSFKKVFNDYCGGSSFRGYFEIYEMGCIYTFPPIHATLHDPQPGYKYSHDIEPCDQIGAAAQIFLFLSNQGTDYTQYFETYLFTHNGNVSAGYASHDYKLSFAVLNPNYDGSYIESELAYNSTNIVAFGNYSENSNFAINLATGGWHMQNAVEYNRTNAVPMTVQDYISGNITQKNLIKMYGLPERLYFAIWKDGDTALADKYIHVVFSYYNPDDTITVCYVARYVPLVNDQFDIFEHIVNCWNNLPNTVNGDNDMSEIVQYFVFSLRCPVDTWIHETTIDQINIGDIHPANYTCDGMWGCLRIFNFSASTTSRVEDKYEYYGRNTNSTGENPSPEWILNKPALKNNYIEEDDIGKIYINGYDNITVYYPDPSLKAMVGVDELPSCFEASNGDIICHLHCLKEGWYLG